LSIKYLFGANANKIQKYVFNANKFKEIVGASKIIELLSDAFGLFGKDKDKNKYDAEIIQNATGSFKAVFPDLDLLNEFIIDFNKQLSIYAPNLLVTQAIIEKEDSEINNNFSIVLKEIDDKLSTNRNFPEVLDYSPMIAKIYPATGFASIDSVKIGGEDIGLKNEDNSFADFETLAKLDLFKNTGDRSFKSFFTEVDINSVFKKEESGHVDFDLDKIFFELEFDKIKNKKSLIAVVHSDGNGTGFLKKAIFAGGDKNKENFDNKNDYKSFSENLNRAVKESACYAIANTFKDLESKKKLPFRIFTLSGEDFNFVCHPDYVFELLRNYILKYEELTSKYLEKFLKKAGISKMTTTAGISFSKSHFPFYMSFSLAENLCGRAKKITKDNLNGAEQYKVPSTMLFHFMQSSHFSDLDYIIEKERKSHNKSIDFLFGPYTIKDGHSYGFTYPDLGLLIKTADLLKKEKGLRSAFRESLSIINIEGEKLGINFLKRAKEVNKEQMEKPLKSIKMLNDTDYYNSSKGEEKPIKSAIYDIIAIESSIDAKWSN